MIGVGITTFNRRNISLNTVKWWKSMMPKNSQLVIVDDFSNNPFPNAYRMDKRSGIAKSKNKCFEILLDKGCEHIFLSDDDFFPLEREWYSSYIDSGQLHLNYIFPFYTNGKKVNKVEHIFMDDKINAYTHPMGCFMYFHKQVIEQVGMMNEEFVMWGYEHKELSDRIYDQGLTLFPYMDSAKRKRFYSYDENQRGGSVFTRKQKDGFGKINKEIYDRSRYNHEKQA